MQDRTVVFAPADTNYEMRLEARGSLEGARVGVILKGLIRAIPRKVWTVPSGGNFIDPIFGPPRRIQGRIRYLDDQMMVIQCGAPIIVALPPDPTIYDLPRGPLTVGVMANVAVMPDATFELVEELALKT
jgi:hypothetical protein